jgi:hypothetical protein
LRPRGGLGVSGDVRYRRIDVDSMKAQPSEHCCLTRGYPLETLTGQTYVAYRLTMQPEKVLDFS